LYPARFVLVTGLQESVADVLEFEPDVAVDGELELVVVVELPDVEPEVPDVVEVEPVEVVEVDVVV
jgi:hypothetical protein